MCNRSLHKFPGGAISLSWISWLTLRYVSGMPTKRLRKVGPNRFSALQIAARLHERQGKAVTNFGTTLPPAESDMAAQIFKDPYLFDFLGTADPRREREVEQALIDEIQRFLLELGAGFAFVGRQVHLEFASQDFYWICSSTI